MADAQVQIDQGSADQHAAVAKLLGDTPLVQDRHKADQVVDDQGSTDQPTDDPTPPRGSDDQLDDVSALLADAEPRKDTHTDGAAGAAGKVDTLEALAEQLGVKPDEIYKLQIPMRDDGTMVTLGALKDQAGKALDLDDQSAEIETRRTAFENDMLRSRQQLNDIVSLLPEVPPALVERARANQIEATDRERNALLEVMPAWKDDQVYQSAQADILEAVADYGFQRFDLDAVVDHRLIKLLHDFTGMKKRIAAANAKAKELRDATPRRGKRVSEKAQKLRGRAAAAEKAKAGTTGDKVAAVGQILSGNG